MHRPMQFTIMRFCVSLIKEHSVSYANIWLVKSVMLMCRVKLYVLLKYLPLSEKCIYLRHSVNSRGSFRGVSKISGNPFGFGLLQNS